MVSLYISLVVLFAASLIIVMNENFLHLKRLEKFNLNTVLKVLSIIIFIVYSLRLILFRDKIDYNTVSILIGDYQGMFSKGVSSGMILLRWFTVISWATLVIAPFTKAKCIKNITVFILPIVTILNIIFFKTNIDAFMWEPNEYGYRDWHLTFRTWQFAIEMTLTCIYGILAVYQKIKNKDFASFGKQIGMMFIILIPLLAAFFPQGGFYYAFGRLGKVTADAEVGAETVGFSLIHRITLYFSVAFMLGSYALLRNKSYDTRKLFFLIVSLSGYAQFFVTIWTGSDVGAWPLHICNTAIMLMFFAFVFKAKGIFYFTYFVNVLGALCAMLMPNTTTNAFTLDSVRFWYNHIYAFTIPVLAVALKVFPRPTFKMMLKAIGIFSIYVVVVILLNAWFNRNTPVGLEIEPRTDYFFMYSSFFVEKFTFATNLQYKHILDVNIGGNSLKFFYLFQPTVYLVFIALMFITWYVYDALFKVSDDHYQLLVLKRSNNAFLKTLYKEMDGRKISEPLNLEGTNMIKISHFTKVYGSSQTKSVDDFSLEINDGEVFGFLGHNGAGKSTTIKSLVGIQSITSGKIEVCGYDVQKQPLEAKLQIGYVSDNHAVYEKLTAREYINYVADLYKVSVEDREERLNKYAKIFQLEDSLDREIKSFSHGMKQKVVVISSLIHNPKVWVLDEPLTGLDPTSSYQIKECMREHANNGNIVFFSSHVIEVVEKICDKIAIIGRGKLKGVFSLSELREKGISLEKLYLEYVGNVDSEDTIDLNKWVEAKELHE